MADYSFIQGGPDVRWLGPTTSEPIQRVEAQANGSGVVFHQSFPADETSPSVWAATLDRLAQGFDASARNPAVVAMSTTEQIGPNNQLLDLVNITLQSTSGKLQNDYQQGYAIIEVNPETGNADVFNDWVSQRVAELDALEGAG